MHLVHLLVLPWIGSSHAFWQPAPQRGQLELRAMAREDAVSVVVLRDPLSVLSAAQFLADEMGDNLPLKTGPARVALFMASLLSPGSLPNPFASTRWEPCTYAARNSQGRIVGVLQTALANVADATTDQVRTVRFFQNVVVARSWRRRGVATSLLDVAVPTDLRFDSALAVEPENEAAVALYRQCGFEMVANEPGREGLRLMLRSSSDGSSDAPPRTTGSRSGEPRMVANEEPRRGRPLRRRQKGSATDATRAALERWASAEETHESDRLALQAMLSSGQSQAAADGGGAEAAADDETKAVVFDEAAAAAGSEVETVAGVEAAAVAGDDRDDGEPGLTAAFAASVQSPRWRLRKRSRGRSEAAKSVREAVARWEDAERTGRVPLSEEHPGAADEEASEQAAQAEYRSAIESANRAMELSRWRAAREVAAATEAPASEARAQLAELVAVAEAAEAAASDAAMALEKAQSSADAAFAQSVEARAAATRALASLEAAEGEGQSRVQGTAGSDGWEEEEARAALEAMVSSSFNNEES